MGVTSEEFEAIYAEQGERLLRIAVVVLGRREGAEDAVAEAFARCWRRWRTHRPDDPGAYLRRTLLNELIRQGERRSRTAPPSGTSIDRDEMAMAVDRMEALDVLATLAPRQRAVLACRFLDDRSESATAALLAMPLGTVKSTTARALARLNDVLGGDDPPSRDESRADREPGAEKAGTEKEGLL